MPLFSQSGDPPTFARSCQSRKWKIVKKQYLKFQFGAKEATSSRGNNYFGLSTLISFFPHHDRSLPAPWTIYELRLVHKIC